MLNNKQRSRWLSEIISEVQRYISKCDHGTPEIASVQRALNTLNESRGIVNEKIKGDDSLDRVSKKS